jgi:hypothetical protein
MREGARMEKESLVTVDVLLLRLVGPFRPDLTGEGDQRLIG